MAATTVKEYIRAKKGYDTLLEIIEGLREDFNQKRINGTQAWDRYHQLGEELDIYNNIMKNYPLRRSNRARCLSKRASELVYGGRYDRIRRFSSEYDFFTKHGDFDSHSAARYYRKDADKALFAH